MQQGVKGEIMLFEHETKRLKRKAPEPLPKVDPLSPTPQVSPLQSPEMLITSIQIETT